MQLGARWNVGDAPHRSVPPTLHSLIEQQERAHPEARSWTLTWLEGRPRCALDDLALVTLDASGVAVVLSTGAGGADNAAAAGRSIAPGAIPPDDDDDWLS